jgi:hypothetical protein
MPRCLDCGYAALLHRDGLCKACCRYRAHVAAGTFALFDEWDALWHGEPYQREEWELLDPAYDARTEMLCEIMDAAESRRMPLPRPLPRVR